MIVMGDEFKEKLRSYVENGGKVLMTPRTAWKDEDNNLVFGKRLPVDLTDLTGCMIEEHESLLTGQSARCDLGTGYVFAEMLAPTTAEVIARWVNNPFGDYAAATVNRYGKGECYYLGSSFDEVMLDILFDRILA